MSARMASSLPPARAGRTSRKLVVAGSTLETGHERFVAGSSLDSCC
jgi:hypothetical protein